MVAEEGVEFAPLQLSLLMLNDFLTNSGCAPFRRVPRDEVALGTSGYLEVAFEKARKRTLSRRRSVIGGGSLAARNAFLASSRLSGLY